MTDEESYIIKKSTLVGIADAVREKLGGSSESIPVTSLASFISAISGAKIPDGYSDMTTGSFSSTTTGNKTISHGMTSATPTMVIVWLQTVKSSTGGTGSAKIFQIITSTAVIDAYSTGTATSSRTLTMSSTESSNITSSQFTITASSSSNRLYGDYTWIALS